MFFLVVFVCWFWMYILFQYHSPARKRPLPFDHLYPTFPQAHNWPRYWLEIWVKMVIFWRSYGCFCEPIFPYISCTYNILLSQMLRHGVHLCFTNAINKFFSHYMFYRTKCFFIRKVFNHTFNIWAFYEPW